MNDHADAAGASPSGDAHSKGDHRRIDPVLRWTIGRDVCATLALLVSLCLPWNIAFGFGVPGSSTALYAVVWIAVLLSLAAIVVSHVGAAAPLRAALDPSGTGRLRLFFTIPLILVVGGFVVFTIVQTLRLAGTGTASPGVGPGAMFALAGGVLGAQPPIGSPAVARWKAWTRGIARVAIVLAVLSALFNLYWRTEYMWGADSLGGADAAGVVLTVLYAVVAVAAVVIGCNWIRRDSDSARLALVVLGGSALIAVLFVWSLSAGREIDAFHGITQSTSTAAVGYEGYLAWIVAGAVSAVLSWSAVTSTTVPDRQLVGAAVRTVLTLVAFWCVASIVLRVADFVVAASLDLLHSLYDTAMLVSFDAVTAVLALWLRRNFDRASVRVLIGMSTALVGFAIGRVVIGVAMAPRVFYVDGGPAYNPVYGNTLAQQITSTFDVVICGVALSVLAAAVIIGALGTLPTRQVPAAVAGVAPTAPKPARDAAAPAIVRPPAPEPDPVPGSAADRIQRVLADSTQRFGAGTTYTGSQRGDSETSEGAR